MTTAGNDLFPFASTVMTFFVLAFVQLVFAFLNLMYLAMENRRVSPASQRTVRRVGLGAAVGMRIVGLGGVALALTLFTADGALAGPGHHPGTVAALSGLMAWIALREVFHLLSVDHLEVAEAVGTRPPGLAMRSCLLTSALFGVIPTVAAALFTDEIPLIIAATTFTMVVVIWVSDHATRLIERHRGIAVASTLIILSFAAALCGQTLFSWGGARQGLTSMSDVTALFLGVTAAIGLGALLQYRYIRAVLRGRTEAANAGIPTTEPPRSTRPQK